MKNYCALVSNNVVDQIIVADYQWVIENLSGDWHDLGQEPLFVGVGYSYDRSSGTFSPPMSVEEE